MTAHATWAGRLDAPARRRTTRNRVEADGPAVERTDFVECFLAGDARALAALFAQHGNLVYNIAWSIARDHEDAEDIVNHTFAKAWRERDRFDPARGSFPVCLLVIAGSRSLDVLPARTRREMVTSRFGLEAYATAMSDRYHARGQSDTQQAVEHAELCEAVHVALVQLPPAQRTVIELAYLGHHSHADVAAQLGVPLGTVKTRARSALSRMRKALETANANANANAA